jgi:adenylate cyclase class 2
MRHRETEVKIRIADVARMRRRLRELGFRPVHRRALEDNVLYDTADRALRKVRSILRVRRYASSWLLTYKGTPDPDETYKSRVELEMEIADPRIFNLIFNRIGLRPVFRYQKYRVLYAGPARQAPKKRRERAGEVSLDETPVGNFLELEGARSWIDRVARELGFSRADYLTDSYGALYLEDCRRRGVPPGDMVFARSRSGRSGHHRAAK